MGAVEMEKSGWLQDNILEVESMTQSNWGDVQDEGKETDKDDFQISGSRNCMDGGALFWNGKEHILDPAGGSEVPC